MPEMWRVVRAMKLYLAGGEGRHWLTEEYMKVFLAGFCDIGVIPKQTKLDLLQEAEARKIHKPYMLESFFYCDEETERLIPYFGDFILDSGAFTFCGTGNFDKLKFDEYIEKYADFIKRNKVEKFFELDVDSIMGYEKVLEYRERLERLTGKQPIPVWHISRGKEEFIRHCDEYPYVALGGYVAAIKSSDPRQKAYVRSYPWFINEAHKRGCKIHGLGYTSLQGLTMHHFDSVDSTAWTTGNRFGYLYQFDGRTIRKYDAPKGKRLGDPRKAALINFMEWIKFQQYAETHL